MLCCFLNRIEHNYEDGSQSKNSDPFEYPESFSMAEYPSHPYFEHHFVSSKVTHSCRYVHESLGPDSVYDLYAVVVHTGAVLAGHYFSFMRPEVCPSTPPLNASQSN